MKQKSVPHFFPISGTYRLSCKKQIKINVCALTKNVLSRIQMEASKIPIEQTSGGAIAEKTDLVGSRFSSVGKDLTFIVFVETFHS